MPGTFTKIYAVLTPIRLPVAVRCDLIAAGLVIGSVTKTVTAYGNQVFTVYVAGAAPPVGAVTSKLYFQDGDSWTTNVSKRIQPYAFTLPLCFSGLKFGWR